MSDSPAATTAASTAGIELRGASNALRDAVELLSSMRFAIALLSLICIASVIGTVVQQHQPPVNYVNQFGPFWAEVFGRFGLYTVYSTPWFLVILGFLVTSTSLCILRNAPKILVDLRTYKEGIRASALKAFHHRASGELPLSRDAALARVSELLSEGGWKAKAQIRESGADRGVMVAAKRGGANKLGYLAAHSAIVLICIGGLSDGDLVVRAQMALQGKTPFGGSGLIRDVSANHRLGVGNPTYRANLFVPEGSRAGTALINLTDGVVLQDLPFDVELKKFIVDYYPTGMPKLFASEIVIHDPDGKRYEATVKVNEPVVHKGVTIYQSSFEDGGSKLTMKAHPFGRPGRAFDVKGEVGGFTTLAPDGNDQQALRLEFTGLRAINVENLAAPSSGSTDVRRVDLTDTLSRHLGSGARTPTAKTLRNVGPSVSYKLRDASGQAREYNNYMLPLDLDGVPVFLVGVRDMPDQPFRYLRIPADAKDSPDDWLRLKAALADARSRDEAASRFARHATPHDRPTMMDPLRVSAQKALSVFAGAEPAEKGQEAAAGQAETDRPVAGLVALQRHIETHVPEAEREKASDVLIRLLNGALFELLNVAREQDGLAALPPGEAAQRFMGPAVLALADSFAYPAPLLLMPDRFEQVQASVFQVTRSPGKTLVYMGCVLLIIGVFAMLYVRERRLWIWIEPVTVGAADNSRLTMAQSATRQTMDNDRDFDKLKTALLGGTTSS